MYYTIYEAYVGHRATARCIVDLIWWIMGLVAHQTECGPALYICLALPNTSSHALALNLHYAHNTDSTLRLCVWHWRIACDPQRDRNASPQHVTVWRLRSCRGEPKIEANLDRTARGRSCGAWTQQGREARMRACPQAHLCRAPRCDSGYSRHSSVGRAAPADPAPPCAL